MGGILATEKVDDADEQRNQDRGARPVLNPPQPEQPPYGGPVYTPPAPVGFDFAAIRNAPPAQGGFDFAAARNGPQQVLGAPGNAPPQMYNVHRPPLLFGGAPAYVPRRYYRPRLYRRMRFPNRVQRKRQMKKDKKPVDKPKRKRNGFIMFFVDCYKREGGDKLALAAECGRRWRLMSEEEKNTYKEEPKPKDDHA